jgi:hypothetical protein
MLITLLSRLDLKRSRRNKKVSPQQQHQQSSTTTPLSGDSVDPIEPMKTTQDWQDTPGEWHYVIPITEEEGYEVIRSEDVPPVISTTTTTRGGGSTDDSPSPPRSRSRSNNTATDAAAAAATTAAVGSENRSHNNKIKRTTSPSSSSSSVSRSPLQKMTNWRQHRYHQRQQLGASISKMFAELTQEQPDQMEEEAIRRAIELSMLDFAIVTHRPNNSSYYSSSVPFARAPSRIHGRAPHDILGVTLDAHPTEIKTAYRKLARLHHPDKGGDASRFEEIARAYRSLLSSAVGGSSTNLEQRVRTYPHHIEEPGVRIKSTAHWDQELQDHRRLVNDLFQADGIDLEACVAKQLTALDMLGLTFKDAGATNRNEQNEIIHNSCFYLSLAASYLWGIGALTWGNYGGGKNNGSNGGSGSGTSMNDDDDWLDEKDKEMLVGETALQLKRTIEAAVVKAHPEWAAQGKVGEEVQAFSDFLVYTLDSQTLLSDWAVVIFDATSGFCDIYKGQQYDKNCASTNTGVAQSNTITLRYIPGHYQPLIPSSTHARRPTLADTISALDDLGVFYVVTDGNS